MNKTIERVHAEYEAIKRAMAELQNRQASLTLLHQFQCQGVSRPDWTWFIAGNVNQA
ncbi:MAG: hypothetical protein AMXMBFR67_37310 [Nitrospira sp.]